VSGVPPTPACFLLLSGLSREKAAEESLLFTLIPPEPKESTCFCFQQALSQEDDDFYQSGVWVRQRISLRVSVNPRGFPSRGQRLAVACEHSAVPGTGPPRLLAEGLARGLLLRACSSSTAAQRPGAAGGCPRGSGTRQSLVCPSSPSLPAPMAFPRGGSRLPAPLAGRPHRCAWPRACALLKINILLATPVSNPNRALPYRTASIFWLICLCLVDLSTLLGVRLETEGCWRSDCTFAHSQQCPSPAALRVTCQSDFQLNCPLELALSDPRHITKLYAVPGSSQLLLCSPEPSAETVGSRCASFKYSRDFHHQFQRSLNQTHDEQSIAVLSARLSVDINGCSQ